jgi:UDP-N-acetylmuramate--alanine ligase
MSGRFFSAPAGSVPTMPVPSLRGVRSVHLIGAGGAGMRNLGRLLLARGVAVTGSDLKDSNGLRGLEELGARIFVGHDPSHLGDPDAVVISTAISDRNVELSAARARDLPVWARAQAIAAIAQSHRSIAVAGTHGKTTTTSMIAVVLERAGLDPTFLIGGDLNESGSGARAGQGDLFVFEADESDGSFLLTDPHLGVITNVDVDHLDFYPGGREQIRDAFAEFAASCTHLVACGDDPGVRAALTRAEKAAVTYGLGDANTVRLKVGSVGPGGATGRLRSDDGLDVELSLRIDGAHNLLNASAALATARMVGVDPFVAVEALAAFSGVHRRFEHRGSARGAEFFDDYGHVPAELAATLDVARRLGPRRLIALFQPHRYSRTQALWKELGASLVEADLILVTDVYGADQEPIPGVTGRLVVDGVELAAPEKSVVYLPHVDEAVEYLNREVREGDLVITMGCGDVWMLGDAALARIREASG